MNGSYKIREFFRLFYYSYFWTYRIPSPLLPVVTSARLHSVSLSFRVYNLVSRLHYDRPWPRSKREFSESLHIAHRPRCFEDSLLVGKFPTRAREHSCRMYADTIARGNLITEARLRPLLKYGRLIAGILNVGESDGVK